MVVPVIPPRTPFAEAATPVFRFRVQGRLENSPKMSATEAQLGLASEFEFEFELKFGDRV